MRQYKITFITIFFIFIFVVSSNAADVAKIGVVDLKRVFDNSDAGKSAQAELTKQAKKMEAELEKEGAEIEKIQKNLERQAAVISKEAREEKKRELQIKIYDFKSLEKKYKTELKRSERKIVIKIQKNILNITQEIGKKEGYLMIFDKSVVMYVPKTLDLTDKVIQEYNKQFTKKAE